MSPRARSKLSTRTLAGVVALALAAGFVAVAVLRSGNEGNRSSPTTASEPTSSTSAGAPAGGTAYAPNPERRFIRVGTNNRRQFTDQEFETLARDYDVVLLTKFHAGYDIAKHHEAARRLKALRPDIEVYPYWSTKYWFDKDAQMGVQFRNEWYLRDNDGNVIVRSKRGEDKSKYVDLANPDYRNWALSVLASWLRAAPYAGLSFDAADPIGDYGKEVGQWDRQLGSERIRAYNDGMRDLLQRAHELVGPNRRLVYNGFSPNPRRGPGRNLDFLAITDGALSEQFCIGPRGRVDDIEPDLAIMREHPDKKLFFRSNYRASFGDRERYQRLCFGAFLLGWEPGRSYYQFGNDYTSAQLSEPAPDLDVNVGRPTGPAEKIGGLRRRRFEHGVVLVNVTSRPLSARAPEALDDVRGGRVAATLKADATLTVPAHDTVFLLDPALVAPSSK